MADICRDVYNFAGCIKILLQKVRFRISTVRDRKTIKNKKRPPDGRRPFLLPHLFYNGKNKSHKSFGEAYGFSFSYKSGITFTISHIFVFCPAGSYSVAAFKLAAIIIKRNVREHKIKSFRYSWGTRCSLAAGNYINELSVRRVHYNATKLANQYLST